MHALRLCLLCIFSLCSLSTVVPRLAQSEENTRLPTEQPEVLWKFVSETLVMPDGATKMVSLSGAIVADGVIYFGDDKGRLFALKANDGAEVWKREHGARIVYQPSADKDHLYFGSEFGITAVRRDNGEVVWRHDVKHGATDTVPISVDDRVYASGYDGNAYALDRKTGEVLWKHDFAADAPPDQPGFEGKRARFQEIVARPGRAACDGKVFIQCVFDQSRVIGLDCVTGKRLWTFQAAGWMSAAPTLVKDRIYVGSQDSHLYCLDRDTGAVIWKYKTPGWFSSQVAVHEGKVFLTHHRGRLYQIDADSGELLKTFQPMDEIEGKSLHGSQPLIANETAYFCTSKGTLYAFDIPGSAVLWQLRPSEGSELHGNIATDGRRIFVRCSQDLKNAGECAIIAIGHKR